MVGMSVRYNEFKLYIMIHGEIPPSGEQRLERDFLILAGHTTSLMQRITMASFLVLVFWSQTRLNIEPL
jgi:hypothetical protein